MSNTGNFLSWNANEADTEPRSWTGESPLLLEANAGTGKTYSLVRIVKKLILLQGIDLEKIVILTFTKKAAREMRERLHELLLKEVERHEGNKFSLALQQLSYSQITTIHSFCFWIIRQFPEVFGISHEVKLISDKELMSDLVTTYLRQTEIMKLFPNHEQPIPVELSDLKNHIVQVVNHNQALLSKSYDYISYQNWEKKKISDFYYKTTLDFDSNLKDKFKGQKLSYQEMIRLVYEKLVVEGFKNQQPSNLVLKLRSRFQACVVDEFQDTDLYQWEIVKSIFELGQTPVVVIGDPKQSIYAFRGADLRVYQRAKEEIKAAGGVWARLTTNYRTVQGLLHKTNWLSAAIFHSTGENWGKLTYQKDQNEWSRPCDEQDLKIRWADKTNNEVPTLQWIDFVKPDSIAEIREQFIKEIIKAIPQLIGRSVEVKSEGGWMTRPLTYADIAVLADRNMTLQKINKELTQSGIPSIVVGKADIWQSEAAYELHRLFRFLERPTDSARRRALLFGVWAQADLNDIEQEQSALNMRLEKHLVQGLDFYNRHQFSALINWVSLWSPNWLVQLLTQNRGERLLTDLYHLMDLATEAANNRIFQSKTPLEWVEQNFMTPTDSEEIEDIRLDKSSDAVRLLTLHNSKGLEFPVVFLMYGLGYESINYTQNGLAVYRGESAGLEKGHWWFANNLKDFGNEQLVNSQTFQGDSLKEGISQDRELEEKRLWYVGITRAQLALYLPHSMNTPNRAKIRNLFSWFDDFKENLSGEEQQEFEQIFKPQKPTQISVQDKGEPSIQTSFKTEFLQLNYSCPLPLITSFSNEHNKRQRQPQKEMENAESRETDESAFTPNDTDLFGGTWFGNLFHKAMELWNWTSNPDPQIVLDNPNLATILNENPFEEFDRGKLLTYLEKLMRNTLSVPLVGLDCSLQQLQPQQLKKEISFLNHESDNHRFVKGVIDVLILLKNRFYIIDYKTNLLKSYDQASLEKAMQENDYTLQAQFYAEAVKKHLKNLTGSNYRFGGCLYLFVRALDVDSGALGQYYIKGE